MSPGDAFTRWSGRWANEHGCGAVPTLHDAFDGGRAADLEPPQRQDIRDAIACCFSDTAYEQQYWRVVAEAFDAAWPDTLAAAARTVQAEPAPPALIRCADCSADVDPRKAWRTLGRTVCADCAAHYFKSPSSVSAPEQQ
jgi:hypothetical protein